jgi:predicted phosphodiesterase
MSKSNKKAKLEKILLIPDCHHPYVDQDAWDLMLKAGKAFAPKHVIIMGDFSDFYAVSSHSKDPNRALKLKEEIEATKKALDQVVALGGESNVFVAGNHEDRLERYLRDRAPELFNFISIPKILELKEKGFKYVPYKQSYKIGKLNVTHDCGNAGRHAHYKSLDTFQHNIVIGHTHRLGYAVEGNAQGERHLTAMFGWLGDVEEIDYMHRVKALKDWSHGFGTGYLDTATGVVYVTPVPIINNTVLIEGDLIRL